jgi:cell division protease FtsH
MFLGRDIQRRADYSEKTAQKIDAEIRRIIDEALQRAQTLVVENRHLLDAIAEALLKYEVLDGSEVDTLIAGGDIREERNDAPPDAAADSVETPAETDAEHDSDGRQAPAE